VSFSTVYNNDLLGGLGYGQPFYAVRTDSGAWKRDALDYENQFSLDTSIALTPEGTPVVAYHMFQRVKFGCVSPGVEDRCDDLVVVEPAVATLLRTVTP